MFAQVGEFLIIRATYNKQITSGRLTTMYYSPSIIVRAELVLK